VQTIHAFCERLLQRFPLEAGVPPGFVILDDHAREMLLKQATDETLSSAAGADNGPLRRALETAITYAVNESFDGALKQALAELANSDAFDEAALAAHEARLRTEFGVRPGATSDDLVSELSAAFADDMLPVLVAALREGNKSDIKQAECLRAAIAAGSGTRRAQALTGFFFTQSNGPRERLATRKVSDARPELLSLMQRAQNRFVVLRAELRALMMVEATMALMRLAGDVLVRFVDAKARNAALDFEDLVGRAAGLLSSSRAVEWVLYKLDGGLDHILVDEAQDTSRVQWDVIRSLAEEFFAGHGARDVTRTLFAVGDEKQSIYSFQGAAPAMFAKVGEQFATRAALAGLELQRVPLTLSFRSAEPVLEAVDAVFADRARTPGVGSSATTPIRHAAHRIGHAGLVEIWPTEKVDKLEPAETWSPLAEGTSSSPVNRLAARIADTISGWLSSGEKLESAGRPIRAGDILILVRKRTPFAPAMISALKARGIKVAGADRLVLTEQIAVQDLMALGDVLLLPDDDLALASVLKSPLFGFDDDDLLLLAPKRKGSLWQELAKRPEARFRVAADVLARWQRRAGLLPPFEFFAELLDGDGMRGRLLERLGVEAADALDEFVNLALSHEDTAAPSLQGFLSWLREGTRVIKRDMEQGLDEVRVMTVHGAKGLEAPIVFLPDTCSTRSGRFPGSLLKLDTDPSARSGLPRFAWPVKGTGDLPPLQKAKATVARGETEERNRLLYVALTRARDRLYVAGFEGSNAPPADCWYNLITDALRDRMQEAPAADGSKVWRLSSRQSAEPEGRATRLQGSADAAPLPAWALRPAPREPLIAVPLAPSRLAPLDDMPARNEQKSRRAAEPAILTPSVLADDARFLRGTITHALLEHLPALPRDRWESAAQAFTASRAGKLPPSVRSSIAAEALAVLHDPAFAALFGPDARAEVPIVATIPDPAGRAPSLRLAGKIDRLARDGEKVLIVDYKTNRPPPRRPEEVAEAYLLQLAAYRLAVARIFAGQPVVAAILWTDGPRIMEIPGPLLDGAERRLWQASSEP
jgi:ATP-dependent helicase/nuclease subunit A